MRGLLLSIIVYVLIIGFSGCNRGANDTHNHYASSAEHVESNLDSTILIPIESVSSDYFPCSDCHSELLPDIQRRELVEMHDDIVFDHDSENRWCLACHDTNQRDSLILAGGQRLGLNESYKLCGQCHGPKYRDWKLGIHGKRTGEWNGEKQYHLCVHCHDPHSPKIKGMKPMPPPRKPELQKIDTIYERQETISTSP